MILFYGRQDDSPLVRAVQAARDLGLACALLDQATLGHCDMLVEVGTHGVTGRIVTHGVSLDLQTIAGVYARPLDLPVQEGDRLARLRAQAFHDLFVEWLDLTPTLVINRPLAMESNSSKPYQAQQIRAAGFAIPETLVTSDPEEARAFRAQHGRVVFKSLSGIRSIVRELDDRSAARLDLLRHLPVQFQAYVPGEDVRVHVVGRESFACLVQSAAVDYRYASRDGLDADLTELALPAEIRERCCALAARLGLPFCGIDLRRTPDGQWVCFEVNPMPAYSFFDIGPGSPIARAVVELLAVGP
jgi:glutathione synthase/RimK-type ligase-like ATP-grasp enzyme